VGKTISASPDLLPDGTTSDVETLLAQARAAASEGKSRECLSLVWALKDSQPEWADVRSAVEQASPRTLLHSIAEAGLEAPARALLEFGISVNTKDSMGLTALHLAAKGNHSGVAKQLLCRGRAHVDTRDKYGRTPLHIATDKRNRRVSRVLVRFGANLQAVDGQGEKPKTGKLYNDKGWHERWEKQRDKTSANIGRVQHFNALGTKLPAHVVAPELKLTPTGYCPVEDGKVKQLPRGIRFAKRRSAPSSPKGKVNWYAPRG